MNKVGKVAKKTKTKKASEEPTMDIIKWLDKKIEETLNELEKQIKASLEENKKKKLKTIYPKVFYLLSKDNNLSELENREFTNDVVFQALKKFQYLIMKLNDIETVVPSRELFCNFIGWSTNFFAQALDDSSSIKESVSMVEDYLIDLSLSLAQERTISPNIAKFRNQVSGTHGHSLVTKKEETEVKKFENRKTKEALQKELEELRAANKQIAHKN